MLNFHPKEIETEKNQEIETEKYIFEIYPNEQTSQNWTS